jgi:hypothetical protein
MNGGLRVENSSATIHTSTAPLAEESAICFLRGDLIAVEVFAVPPRIGSAYSALIKLMSPLRSTRATLIFERSSVAASSRMSSSRSCSEM